MPQMSPIYWEFLFLSLLLTIVGILVNFYFSQFVSLKSTAESTWDSAKKEINWAW